MHEYAGYYRKSVGRKGIEQQRRSTRAAVARLGARITYERDDKDRTAYRDLSAARPPRPGFDEVLAWLAAAPGRRLAAWHIDRITRDVEEAVAIARTRIYVVTAAGGEYDLSTAAGRKRFIGDANDARGEIDHNIERILERKNEHAAEGRWLGGPVPFGWRAVPRDDPDEPALLELDDAEAQLLREAKDDVLAGRALHAVAVAWNGDGWRTRRGNPWAITTVRQVLVRPRNAGLMQHRGQLTGRAQWPPLWEQDAHEALRAVLTDPARRSSPGGPRRYLLSGIALCGECGTAAQIRISDRVPYYACPASGAHPMRHQERTDAWVTEILMLRLERGDAAGLLRADTRAGRTALLARRGVTEGLMDSRGRMHEEGLLTDAEFVRGRRRHLAELEEVAARLEELNRADALAPLLASPRAAWAATGLDGRRAATSLMAVTLFPGRAGRPAGWRPGQPYFDYGSVDVRFLRDC